MKWLMPMLAGMLVVAACSSTAADTTQAPAEIAVTSSQATPAASTSLAPVEEIRILVLGDSYSVGEGVPPEEAWPARLGASLGVAGYDVDVDVIAATGWTSQRVASETRRSELGDRYDLVVVGVGSNDHFNQFGTEQLRAGVGDLLDRTAPLVATPDDVLILSIVDWRLTPRGSEYAGTWRDRDVAPYNDALAEIAQARGARYVDVTGVSRIQGEDPAFVAQDGLHGSGLLYERWVEVLVPVAVAAVG